MSAVPFWGRVAGRIKSPDILEAPEKSLVPPYPEQEK